MSRFVYSTCSIILTLLYCSNFCGESRTRIASVAGNIRQVSSFIREHMDAVDLDRSNDYTRQSLIEFDRVIAATATPFVIIRGTGEIMRVNENFARLVNVPSTELTSRQWRICQFMTEEALVNFCEKVVAMYFDSKQHALLTNCVLVPGGLHNYLKELGAIEQPDAAEPTIRSPVDGYRSSSVKLVPCGINAMVRRDMFNLPVLIALTIIPMT